MSLLFLLSIEDLNGRCGLKRVVKTNCDRMLQRFPFDNATEVVGLGNGARIICSIQATLIVLLLSCYTPTTRTLHIPQIYARSDTKAISLCLTAVITVGVRFPFNLS